MLSLVGQRDDVEFDVQRLLDELCIKLGFCLPPDENRRLRQSSPADVDSFTDAVIEAEGMGDMSYTDLRRQVREVVDQHMSRWVEADHQVGGGSTR
jgi:hypothetical protein